MADFESKGIEFATLTHAAGISSTGDPELDRLLPFDEPYFIPESTADSIRRAGREDRCVIAVGTTVVRALEHSAARFGSVVAGDGLANQRIDARSSLRSVDAILSGTHEPGTSHYELLHAFANEETLRRADRECEAAGYRTHEFGDSVLIERDRRKYSRKARPCEVEDILAGNASTGSADGDTYTPRFLRTPVHVVQESGRLPSARRLVDFCG